MVDYLGNGWWCKINRFGGAAGVQLPDTVMVDVKWWSGEDGYFVWVVATVDSDWFGRQILARRRVMHVLRHSCQL